MCKSLMEMCRSLYVSNWVFHRCLCSHVQHVLCVLFQVSDVEKILGIVQTENIHVNAEAYDIALEISPGIIRAFKHFIFMAKKHEI